MREHESQQRQTAAHESDGALHAVRKHEALRKDPSARRELAALGKPFAELAAQPEPSFKSAELREFSAKVEAAVRAPQRASALQTLRDRYQATDSSLARGAVAAVGAAIAGLILAAGILLAMEWLRPLPAPEPAVIAPAAIVRIHTA